MRAEHATGMAEVIHAIERVAKLPGYIASVQDCDDPIVRFHPGAIGVLMGYDFHLSEDGPKLIEINTNAGGALINAFVARAQRACCTAVEAFVPECGEVDRFEAAVLESFRSEYRRQRGSAPLTRVAIVDADPALNTSIQNLFSSSVCSVEMGSMQSSPRQATLPIGTANFGSRPRPSILSTIA